MKRQLELVRRQPPLRLASLGIFGHFCGLDNIHVCLCSDMLRSGLVSSWPVVVTDGLVCVQQEHTQTELCQASSEPHQSLVRTLPEVAHDQDSGGRGLHTCSTVCTFNH